MYNRNFTTSVQQAIDELNNNDGDASTVSMQKRWDFLRKFQQNWDHWFVF